MSISALQRSKFDLPSSRIFIQLITLLLLFPLTGAGLAAQRFSIRDFGARGGGADDTEAIQRAIDRVAETGGTLVFPADTFRTGTVELRSGMEIKLQAGTVWQAIPDLTRFPELSFSTADLKNEGGFTMTRRAFILGRNLHNFSLTGPGKIHGNGQRHDVFPFHESNSAQRPYGLYFIGCRGLRLTDLELESSAFWMLRIYRSDDVSLRGLRVFNHANTNNDGIDLVDCHRVTVSGCVVDTSDDALCFKSESPRGCYDVTVTNCILSSTASYIKFGTASFGGFERIAVSNCVLRPTRADTVIHALNIPQGITGLSIMSADGAELRRISFSNIIMEGLSCPIFVRLGKRHRPSHAEYAELPITPGVVEDITFNHIRAYGVGALPITISGYPGHPVRRVRLTDVEVHYGRPGTAADRKIQYPDSDGGYPSPLMFGGNLPAYGAFVRFAEDVRFEGVRLYPAAGETRPAVMTAGETDLRFFQSEAGGEVLRLRDVRGYRR